ncbi:hypothetical protein [Rhizobium tumorigenes]|uniref:DinB/UmuC family translesion DNA polymerase n=1 Tax=Rhizobium tumorigenes TaxID=2041385 RepID=UPI00241E80F6|nr:hypothetical protein [Rhizobium tumorigenes]WFS03221.1 hypothetical protein PR016_21440 [Rhizobium tumorigenes]
MKAKYADFNQIGRSTTVSVPFREVLELQMVVDALLEPVFPMSKRIGLPGITLSSLERAAGSINLNWRSIFEPPSPLAAPTGEFCILVLAFVDRHATSTDVHEE